jgi:hypothetical protein
MNNYEDGVPAFAKSQVEIQRERSDRSYRSEVTKSFSVESLQPLPLPLTNKDQGLTPPIGTPTGTPPGSTDGSREPFTFEAAEYGYAQPEYLTANPSDVNNDGGLPGLQPTPPPDLDKVTLNSNL